MLPNSWLHSIKSKTMNGNPQLVFGHPRTRFELDWLSSARSSPLSNRQDQLVPLYAYEETCNDANVKSKFEGMKAD